MKIPEHIIEEIRRSIDIVELIGSYSQLKKRGKNFTGLCPFHKEKTPSFNVSADKGLFYCFGCKKSGDVFTFAMETQKISYPEAIEFLAEKAGVKIERSEISEEKTSELEKLFSVNSTVAKIFSRNLFSSEEGKFALDYLSKRGIEKESIDKFQIGLSFKQWDSLYKEGTETEGISESELLKLGLIKKREDGSCYDTFRGRIIFPITNPMGRISGFGARKIHEDDTLGKYINSPETIIYSKSRILYGLSFAKDAIRSSENVIVVEGYADFISLFQNGIKNVVATSGTALTIEQVKLISRYTKNIIFIYDADFAGSNAMERGIDIVLSEGLDVRIALLPEGEDPDSFVRNFGAEKFNEIIKSAVSFVEFKAAQLFEKGKFETVESKAVAVRTIVESIAKIPDNLKRTFFIKDVAEKFGIYETTLLNELDKFLTRTPKRNYDFINQTQFEQKGEKPITKKLSLPIEEKDLLLSIFEQPNQIIPFIFQNVHLEELQHPIVRIIIEEVLEMFEENQKIDERILQERLPSEESKSLLAEILFSRYELSSRWDDVGARLSDARWFEIALGAIKKIKKRFLQDELQKNKLLLQEHSSAGEDPTIYLERQHQFLNQIKEIDNIKLTKEIDEDEK